MTTGVDDEIGHLIADGHFAHHRPPTRSGVSCSQHGAWTGFRLGGKEDERLAPSPASVYPGHASVSSSGPFRDNALAASSATGWPPGARVDSRHLLQVTDHRE